MVLEEVSLFFILDLHKNIPLTSIQHGAVWVWIFKETFEWWRASNKIQKAESRKGGPKSIKWSTSFINVDEMIQIEIATVLLLIYYDSSVINTQQKIRHYKS